MAYQRKDMLDEDKWNIHSSGYRQEKYGSGKGESSEKYKHEHYGAKKEKEDYSAADDYRKKKEEEDKGPSIEDTVKEDKQKKDAEEEHEVFKIAAKQVAQEFQKEGEKVKTKRKDNKSIEDAINKAVKEEKETIIVDQ